MSRLSDPAPACCAPVFRGRLERPEAEGLADKLKAMADPARLQLLSFLASQPSREACVCHMTEPLGLSQPTVSHHLKVLHEAGLLEREKRGTWVYYRIRAGGLAELRDALALPDGVPDPAADRTVAPARH